MMKIERLADKCYSIVETEIPLRTSDCAFFRQFVGISVTICCEIIRDFRPQNKWRKDCCAN